MLRIFIITLDSSTSLASYKSIKMKAGYLLLGFEEVVFAPVDFLGWPYVLLDLGVLFLAEALDLYHWVNLGTNMTVKKRVTSCRV